MDAHMQLVKAIMKSISLVLMFVNLVGELRSSTLWVPSSPEGFLLVFQAAGLPYSMHDFMYINNTCAISTKVLNWDRC